MMMRIDAPACGFKNCRYSFDCNCCNCTAIKAEYDRCEYRILHDAEVARTHPEPLTVDGIREREGKPVFVTNHDGSGGMWGIVRITQFGVCAETNDDSAYWFTGLTGCIAYPYEPAESIRKADEKERENA